MMNCKDCEYFNGYDYEDGTPNCHYMTETGNIGYDNCPYNNETDIMKKGINIEIDAGFMSDYIKHTISNTISLEAAERTRETIAHIVNSELKEDILSEAKRQISEIISKEIADFMAKDITVGGGWNEPSRTISRNDYLSECVANQMEEQINTRNGLKRYAENEVNSAIDKFGRKLKDEINAEIKNYFNEATRQVLTSNVVSMLMDNETYKRLSDSMQHFLPETKED